MPSLNDQLSRELEKLRATGLYRTLRTVASAQGPHIRLDGREFLNFSSNDYLGLANDPVLKAAATTAIDRYGVGAGASRLVSGNLAPYDDLERQLAAFKGKEAAIVFGSGYAANVGTITALVGEGDVIILDKLDHASIIDGARQSGATIRVYPHGNLKKLEELLRQSAGRRRVLVVTETVFSMDGDCTPLAEIVVLKEKFGAWLMIDEAHATGVFGKHRRGLAEELDVEDRVDVTLGTLSKALGCAGGFVVGSQVLIDYLRNRARSLIYSTALPPAVVAAASAAVELVAGAEGRHRQERLWANVRAFGAASPIVPVIVGDEAKAVELSRQLYEEGIFVPAIRYPTVPKGKARLRVTVTAGHEEGEVRRLQEAFRSRLQTAPTSPGVPMNSGVPTSPGVSTSPSASTGHSTPPNHGAVGAVCNRDPQRRPPHSADLRKGRVSMPRECYFLTTNIAGKQPMLTDPAAAKIVIDALRWLRDEGRIRLLGFVVMPDHVHVALVLGEGQTLAAIMRSWKRFSARAIRLKVAVENRSHDTEGLWQDGYYDHHLRDRRDFEKRLQYMHENPVRQGLVNAAQDWPFSTAHPDYAADVDWEWVLGVAVENRSHEETR